MTKERYIELEYNLTAKLTAEEIDAGYHFCPDWDYLLICPGMPEYDTECSCLEAKKSDTI